VHGTSSKNAQVSPATTSFPWRHTNTCKNHGYNAVADDSGKCRLLNVISVKWHYHLQESRIQRCRGWLWQVSSATTWRHINTRKNHGYNAVAQVSYASSHVVPRVLYSIPTKKVKKVVKGQTFSDHTYAAVSSRPRGRCVQSLVQIGSEMWICIRYRLTNKNEQKPISALCIICFVCLCLYFLYTFVKSARV
jgi:hypothetical protein